MPEKLTLAVYLEKRGAVKALTRIEAEAFGVPYPLVKGWATRHCAIEITQDMLNHLQEKIVGSKSSTAEKAMRGLEGVEGIAPAPVVGTPRRAAVAPTERLSPIPGFVLRQARRYRVRRPSIWA